MGFSLMGLSLLVYLFQARYRTTDKAIGSVKGGENANGAMMRDLAHVVKRKKPPIGVFITLAEATKPMLTEAIEATVRRQAAAYSLGRDEKL